MKRKRSKSGLSNCSQVAAKKNIGSQLEWGAIFNGVSRGLVIAGGVLRLIEILKTLTGHCSSG